MFIKTSTPAVVRGTDRFFLNGKPISQTLRGKVYELGNFIYANEWGIPNASLGALIRSRGCIEQLKIADVYFTPVFLGSPLTRDNTMHYMEIRLTIYRPSSAKFTVEVENNIQYDPWIYRQLQPRKHFEKTFLAGREVIDVSCFLTCPMIILLLL